MRIIQLTPGTGSFYCGTCMRDNTLVVALRKLGHDAVMVPMYLEPTLDETSGAGESPLFYGGINVYLQQVSGLFRSTPRWLDRILDAPALLRSAGKRAGATKASELGALTVSMLRGEDGRQAKELDRLVAWLATEGKPDVVCLSNALLIGLARRIKAETGARVVCTLQGEDSFLDSLPEPDRSLAWETVQERAKDVDAFIAVSHYHAKLMIDRAHLQTDRVHVVYNGINLDGYGDRAPKSGPPTIGYLARLCPTKGLHTLIDAFIILRKRDNVPGARLQVAGAMTDSDQSFVAEQQARLKSAGLDADAEFLPNISREAKVRFLQGLSVLSVPATYGESFGLYVIEGLAAGVPFVQPDHAAFPELLSQTNGGVVCKPNDPESLAIEIESLLLDPVRASTLAESGQRAVQERFSAKSMAKSVLAVFEEVINGARV